MEKSTGIVKWFDTAKGYGFIVNEAGEDVFVNNQGLECDGREVLAEGQQVEYTLTRGNKGWQATGVSRLKK